MEIAEEEEELSPLDQMVNQLLVEKAPIINQMKTSYQLDDDIIDNASIIMIIPSRILERVLKGIERPEEQVRLKWLIRLVNFYGYPADRIEIEVPAGAGRAAHTRSSVRADIVVYGDSKSTEPFIVVETKAPGITKGIIQAESYARVLGAEYHVWTNGTIDRFYRTSRYQNKSLPVKNIPYWIDGRPVATMTLPVLTLWRCPFDKHGDECDRGWYSPFTGHEFVCKCSCHPADAAATAFTTTIAGRARTT